MFIILTLNFDPKEKNLLIVHDEFEIRNSIETILEEIGFKTIHKVVKSSELFTLYKDDINLMILDLFMPVVD